MFHKTIFASLLAAAAAGALVAVKVLKDQEKKKDEEPEEDEDDEEVHFIRIEDGDAPEEEKKPELSPEVQEVAAVYPYLDSAFIEKTLAKNDELNQAYADDTLVTVKHHAEFEDAEEEKAFQEILTNGGYEVKTNGKEADASRKFYTQAGAIISDILNVANQTAALKGVYEGYDITK